MLTLRVDSMYSSAQFSHITPLLRRFHWLKAKAWIDFKVAALAWSENSRSFICKTMLLAYWCPRRTNAKPLKQGLHSLAPDSIENSLWTSNQNVSNLGYIVTGGIPSSAHQTAKMLTNSSVVRCSCSDRTNFSHTLIIVFFVLLNQPHLFLHLLPYLIPVQY